MHVGALQALEFDRIVEAVQSFALTPLGHARLAGLRPYSDPRRIAQVLSVTSEAVRFLADSPGLPLEAPPDLESILASLAIEGRALEPLRLLGLAEFLDSVEHVRAAIRRAPSSLPLMEALTETAAGFTAETGDVRQKIDPSGEVLDQASPALRTLRERLRKARARLRGTLESFLRGKETSRYLQDQIVTDRNGRYVLVVRAEHRAAIPGIIHGSSSSGASLYLEPLSTVELNNEIVALQEEEAEEVRRILLALTDAFRHRPLDLQRTVEAATELDVAQAKARFAKLVGGSEPVPAPDGGLELRSARHPLLIAAVVSRLAERAAARGERAAGGPNDSQAAARDDERPLAGGGLARRAPAPAEPVPVDILLTPPSTVLVISGPNTGGKTVALKTVGLLAVMAQAGLHIPAAPGSRLPVFRSVFADIGDEQSIAANLSTFSWHVHNIVSMDKTMAMPALVLLDEVGVGTDPAEGGALGTAVIDHFRRRGALVVATTHYDVLKSYASTTEGVMSAAFGFDPETFEPTYRLVYGSPGRSLALEIAGRLGLNPAILKMARENMSAREAQLAEHLAKIDHDLHALEHERRLVARERETLADEQVRLRGREESLRQREESFKRQLDERLDERLREARRQIDEIVDELKRKTAALAAAAARQAVRRAPALTTGDAGLLRVEARASLDEAVARFRPDAPPSPAPLPPADKDRRPGIGDRVTVGGLGLEGTLVAVHDADAEVDVQGKRLRGRIDDLRLVARAAVAPAGRVSVHVEAREDSGTDLNVIGCTVDEALTRIERFLDQSLLTERRTLRLIHGHGTGQLRRAIAEYLQGHALVTSFASAPAEEGGTGVTVVELK
jgi:DNA mismatch repair protein MutS2